MTYRGHVKNGVVVFEGPQIPPNGVSVEVAVVAQNNAESLGKMLLRHAGKISSLPDDMAEQHDHYLHGTPKR
jgi:hypothetical protein